MLPVMGSAIPAVVDAVPRPGASAAERLAASQASESEGAIKIVSRSLFVCVSIQSLHSSRIVGAIA